MRSPKLTLAGAFQVPGANSIAIGTFSGSGLIDLSGHDSRGWQIDTFTSGIGGVAQYSRRAAIVGCASVPGIDLIATVANGGATFYAGYQCYKSLR